MLFAKRELGVRILPGIFLSLSHFSRSFLVSVYTTTQSFYVGMFLIHLVKWLSLVNIAVTTLMVENCICYLFFFFQLPVLSWSWSMGWSPTLTHQLMVFTTVLQPLTLVAMDTSWSVIQQGFVISLGVLVHGEEQTELAIVRMTCKHLVHC